ncbi:hypothetical protein D0T51_09515 [Parabacteroides sp. 52]|uniref:antitoxin VbhA family protein n=1 Tax=unclassified Parabacteroides TaxID=2649774 RepID=UPI0013D48653|nr:MULTISPECIES: antitoxin VbhA family protein [unclassified Parabacteroides]MDH6535411.1 hypothetical protein [Parabacteroides sp. PM5-20]NDV55962.1 hypothetical protein [Parabacteroides sp. 52]
MTNFEEYLQHPDPEKRERAANWSMAIGLQAVDGLKASNYLVEIARRQIEGEITMDEVQELISAYYQAKRKQKNDADKVIGTDEKL